MNNSTNKIRQQDFEMNYIINRRGLCSSSLNRRTLTCPGPPLSPTRACFPFNPEPTTLLPLLSFHQPFLHIFRFR